MCCIPPAKVPPFKYLDILIIFHFIQPNACLLLRLFFQDNWFFTKIYFLCNFQPFESWKLANFCTMATFIAFFVDFQSFHFSISTFSNFSPFQVWGLKLSKFSYDIAFPILEKLENFRFHIRHWVLSNWNNFLLNFPLSIFLSFYGGLIIRLFTSSTRSNDWAQFFSFHSNEIRNDESSFLVREKMVYELRSCVRIFSYYYPPLFLHICTQTGMLNMYLDFCSSFTAKLIEPTAATQCEKLLESTQWKRSQAKYPTTNAINNVLYSLSQFAFYFISW